MNLDAFNDYKTVDASDMLGFIKEMPDQLANAWAHAATLSIAPEFGDVDRVAICGMGGSAIGGDLFAALAGPVLDKAIVVNRGYDLPAFISGERSLVIAMSHSGSTEETVTAAKQGLSRSAKLLVITTGGILGGLEGEKNVTVWRYSYPSLPRAALGWLYGMLLGAANAMGWLDLEADVAEAVALLKAGREDYAAEVPAEKNTAKQIADSFIGLIPVIWGAGALEPVSRRWKTQINENSKAPAFFEFLPELDHNAVVGTEAPAEGLAKLAIFQLKAAADHPRVAIRQRATAEILKKYGLKEEGIEAEGKSTLANQFSLITLGDYVSFYLAMAYEIDPSPIPQIDALKAELARYE